LASATAAAANPSFISEKAKIQKELVSFVATASYSIPSEVTALAGFETFTTVPAWYSALPSDVKSYYDKNNALVQSVLNQAVLGNATQSGSATKSGTGATASQTGAANKVVAMGAGMAAAFLGVIAL
jgi:hypothetical protein